MTVCYKAYIKSQPLGNHHETQPMGLFCSSWHVSPSVLCCPQSCTILSANRKPVVPARTLEIPFSYDFNKAVGGKML